jgi:hypothetical protein
MLNNRIEEKEWYGGAGNRIIKAQDNKLLRMIICGQSNWRSDQPGAPGASREQITYCPSGNCLPHNVKPCGWWLGQASSHAAPLPKLH